MQKVSELSSPILHFNNEEIKTPKMSLKAIKTAGSPTELESVIPILEARVRMRFSVVQK